MNPETQGKVMLTTPNNVSRGLPMSVEEMIHALHSRYGTYAKVAEAMLVSEPYVWMLRVGKRSPSKVLFNHMQKLLEVGRGQ